MDPSKCVVLVPAYTPIVPGCQEGLQELERRGYEVRRIVSVAALDVARCTMASTALRDGFEEIMWIDSDVAFNADDVELLRSHGMPITCGIYAKKGIRDFACAFMPGTRQVTFGKAGGLIQVRYIGFGFMLTRRSVYRTIEEGAGLPQCNQRFGPPIGAWFLPMLIDDGDGTWYLEGDYAFCERARRAGLRVMADTTIRLSHVGSYPYGWEDAGSDKERFATYIFSLGG